MPESNPIQNNASRLLEFERHDELAASVLTEIEPAAFEDLDFLEDFDARQRFYESEHRFLLEKAPHTQGCLIRLSEAYAYYISPKNRRRAFAQNVQKRQKANECLEKIGSYFRIGGYFGTLAYRRQNSHQNGRPTYEFADLPKELSVEINPEAYKLSYEQYAEFFELLQEHNEELTWQLSWYVSQLPVRYANPVEECQKSLDAGALSAYHLHSLAHWHQVGEHHELALPVDSALYEQIKDPERLSESDKQVIERLIDSIPQNIRRYKDKPNP